MTTDPKAKARNNIPSGAATNQVFNPCANSARAVTRSPAGNAPKRQPATTHGNTKHAVTSINRPSGLAASTKAWSR